MSTKNTPQFKLSQNTDSIDIQAKCLGISVDRESIPRDVMNYIKTDRGLHIQIRHNRDKQTFAQASELAAHIVTAANEFAALVEEVKDKVSNLQSEIDNDWMHELHPEQVTNMEREIKRLKALLARCGVK